MHTDQKLHITSTSLEQSLELGKKIGQNIEPGQLVEFVGDLGGGKTTIIKGIAAGLGITKTVTSPTFNIQRSYELKGGGTLEHFDLYRLETADAVEQELAEYLADQVSIVVVEWAKPFVSKLKPDHLRVELHWSSSTARDITIIATGAQSSKLLRALQ